MPTDRVAALRRMLERNPSDTRALFGLALEYERAGDWTATVEILRTYLGLADDEGNAWGRLARALVALGRVEEAREAYGKGIEAAYRKGHPSMAEEFEEAIEGLG
jgi:Flp pilus assembly protein TadD